VKSSPRRRSVLHVDLDPFFVSVERSLDPSLKGRPLIVGGDGSQGVVAAASNEARAAGVQPGQSLLRARRLCPAAVFRPGDLETYARVSEEVTTILLDASRRVERPSADEAYVDLTPDGPDARGAVAAAEAIKDQLQRRLGLDASLGVASSRLAARVASRWARPRGLLVVLPGYESSFVGRQPLDFLPDLPPHLEQDLVRGGFTTLGQIAEADPNALVAAVGAVAAPRLQAAARGDGEEAISVAAPPVTVQEEATIRARGSDAAALLAVLEGLASRAWRRLRPFDLSASAVTIEVRRGETSQRRSESFELGVSDEPELRRVATELALPLLEPAASVRALQLRLARLARPGPQVPLFPEVPGAPLRRSSLR
jgi:DNA polymerase-4